MNCKVIAKGALTLLTKRFAGSFWIRRRWLNKTQWLSLSELQEIQLRLLKKLIRHCYNSVPFYHKIMDEHGINIQSIKDLEDIKKFPILTKKDVLQAGENIVSTKFPKWIMHKARTGGTTGTPLQIYRTLSSIGTEHAFVRRQWDWAGIDFSDRCAWIIAGRRISNPNRTNNNLYAYDPFMRELTLSIYHLTPKTARKYVEAINRYKVTSIVGISSAIYFLAKICSDANISIKLKAALTTSETLSSSMKETISTTFGCKVFDFYGAAERVCYIHTCEHGTYHIIPEYGLTELIPTGDANTQHYRIIATGFWNLGMPLLRYDTGDIVVPSARLTCPCGRSFPIIESISGRDVDVIKTRSGKQFGPTVVARVLKEANNILESQIIQDSLDHIYVKYVPSEKFTVNDLAGFKQRISFFLPEELRVDLQPVQTIPRTNDGKIKLILSQI
jgi:phenylacetate-CoA ligase